MKNSDQRYLRACAFQNAPARWMFAILFILAAIAPASLLAQTQRIRLMAANLTSGNNQSYDPGNGTRIFQGVDPDVVMIQEFNYGDNTASTIQGWVTSTFGSGYTYYREAGAQIPNGIISRYPILASGEWDDTSVSNRDFSWARIDIPGSIDLWAVSVHLLTTSATVRNTEATQLVSYLNSAGIPSNAFLVIGGDYNTNSRTEACFTTLGGKVVTTGSYPVDKNNNGNTNAARAKPYDHCLVNTNLNAYKTSVVIGASSFANGLVFDSRVYTPLSEVSPVVSNDSGATNMQHMGVIKDFLVPTGGSPTASPTASPTPSPTTAPTASATATASPSPSPSASPSATATPTLTPSPSPSPTATGDIYEADGTTATAKTITVNGATQTHDISPATDLDYVKFTTTATSNIKIETNGPSGGDTYIYLYNTNGTMLRSDDDAGTGNYSLVTYAGLYAGTYYVKIQSYNNASTITGYTVKVYTY